MSLSDYFQDPNADRILLIEIQRSDAAETRYYLSDAPYVTEPTDTPANIPYSAVIGGTGLGDIRRSLNDPFSGQASTGFGRITLVDDMVTTETTAGFSESVISTPRGAQVSAFLAGPAGQFTRASALTLLTGKVARSGGDSDGNLYIEITDGSEVFKTKTVEVTDKPICYGYCRNITPKLTDPALLEYYVHDGPIEEVVAVYDQGALFDPSDYTVDLATGKLTMLVNPVGTLTADVKGAKVGGTWLQSTEAVAADLIDRVGVTITQSYDLPTGLVGLYIQQTATIGELLNKLMQGCAGYWLIGPNNTFEAAQFPVPGETATVATYEIESGQIESSSYEKEERLYSRINFSYRVNYTQYQSRGDASATQAEFSQIPYRQSSVVDGAPVAELDYQDSPQIDTLFDGLSDAQSVANRVLTIYRVPRDHVDVRVPYSTTLQLGQNVEVQFESMTFVLSLIHI